MGSKVPPTKQGLSERAFAKVLGQTRGAVQKHKICKRLVFFADGSIDADASLARIRANIDPSQQRRPKPKPGTKPVSRAAVAAVGATLTEETARLADSGTPDFLQARTAHEVLKVQEKRLRLQKERGELVDRAKAVTLMHRLAREERDAWLNWPARVAPILAAEFGSDPRRMQVLLEDHIRQHLHELAEIKPDVY